MKITQRAEKINLNRVMDVSIDVHKDILNFFFEAGGKEYADECSNRTSTISRRLDFYHTIAREHGMDNLRLICEPTGQYHNKLFRSARSKGFFTCFVNAESVSKFRVIETNDNGKTDFKDPRVIRTLGKLDKVIKHRMLPDDYLLLRKLNVLYDEIEGELIRSRCRIDKVMTELFCDYSFKNDFFYLPSGQTLLELYGCNPYRIMKAGFEEFTASMKKATPRIQNISLQRLWKDAESSALNQQPEGHIEILEMHLKQLTEDWRTQMSRKDDIVERMISVLRRLREEDPTIPPPTAGVISE